MLAEVFDKRLIKLNLESTDKSAVFKEMVEEISAIKPELSRQAMLEALHDREAKMDTYVAPGVAVPHGYFRGLKSMVGAIGFSTLGIDYGVYNEEPVHLLFMLLLGEEERELHLKVLSRILRFIQSGGALSHIKDASSAQSVYNILYEL